MNSQVRLQTLVVVLVVLSISLAYRNIQSQKAEDNVVGHPNLSESNFTQPNKHSVYYYHRVSLFKSIEGCSDIVFIGDSITDSADWNEIFPEHKTANRGVSGDTSFGVLDRLDSIVQTQAQYAYIMIGINDILQSAPLETVYKNYTQIVNHLVQEGMTVYIQSTLLTGFRNNARINSSVKYLNSKLRAYADGKSRIYIDLNQKLSDGSYLNGAFSYDALHLNGDGYKVWKNVIQDYVKQSLPSQKCDTKANIVDMVPEIEPTTY